MSNQSLARPGYYFGTKKTAGTAMGNQDKPYMFIEFELTHFAENGAWVPLREPLNRSLLISLTDNAHEIAEKKLRALGWNGNLQDPEFNPEIIKNLQLKCEHQTYQNKPRENWDFDGWGSSERKPVPADKLAALEARFKTNASMAAPPITGGARPAAPVPPPPVPVGAPGNGPVGEDDIPF